MDICAHRLRPSPRDIGNTKDGLVALYELGVKHVEADVVDIASGEEIIYHPGTTEDDLTFMTWPEIRRTGLKVMSLEEYFCLLKSYRMTCYLELKQNSEQLVEDVVAAIIEHGLQNNIFVTAFQKKINWPLFVTESEGQRLLDAKALNPNIKTHLIAGEPWKLPELVQEFHSDMVSFGWIQKPWAMGVITKALFKFLTRKTDMREQVRKVQGMGIKVMAGIVNDVESMHEFAELGIDMIMTDDVVLGMKFKEEYEKSPA